ncbi:hypothetical protein O7632_00905 [Solwaraspora sp. WMMD406]|uniref:hypothetical protein n=1 Tax=Solwaraspora sp. WMMD406 TaxID=3016095 RepID=UPI002416F4FA|nr:hypothetical protein [Solwaraspora sp. WMMD406]MDG4762682.1 hypothetical protein [Solwaraspora sp. WMMD406]
MRAIRVAGASASAVALLTALAASPSPAHAEPAIASATTSATTSANAAPTGAVGTFNSVGPARLLDTRIGLGAPAGAVTDNQVTNVQVAGLHAVPATGVSAVVLNVTVTAPTAAGHLTVFPTGGSQPATSNLNFTAGKTIANSVTVPVGTGGRVSILHRGGSTQVIADVTGYYISAAEAVTGSEYYPFEPLRILDTRDPSFGGRLEGGHVVTIPIDFGDFYNPAARAVVVNVTAVSPLANGHLTTWNGIGDVPTASTLNFTAGRTVPNLAIVPVARCPVHYPCPELPSIAIHNGSAMGTHVVVDLVGAFDVSFDGYGMRFRPVTPTRITDTRIGLGAPGALGPAATATITSPGTVGTQNTWVLSANVTAVNPTANTHLTIWPQMPGVGQPLASTLNPYAGETVPNAALAWIGPDFRFNIYNHAGSTHVIVDVSGTFEHLYDAPARADADVADTVRAAMKRVVTPQPAFTSPVG